jgi:hypothetical protein
MRKELNDGTETLLAQSGQDVTFIARCAARLARGKR